MSDKFKSKFGNVSLNTHGYYNITSRKEGNHSKMLHRLIWEDFYGTSIPEGFVVHHKNGIKTDNCILNLQLLPKNEHNKLHNINGDNFQGRLHSKDTKILMSKAKNTSGYFGVYKLKGNYTQGFIWVYRCTDDKGNKHIFKSIDLDKLKEKVLSHGLLWMKLKT